MYRRSAESCAWAQPRVAYGPCRLSLACAATLCSASGVSSSHTVRSFHESARVPLGARLG